MPSGPRDAAFLKNRRNSISASQRFRLMSQWPQGENSSLCWVFPCGILPLWGFGFHDSSLAFRWSKKYYGVCHQFVKVVLSYFICREAEALRSGLCTLGTRGSVGRSFSAGGPWPVHTEVLSDARNFHWRDARSDPPSTPHALSHGDQNRLQTLPSLPPPPHRERVSSVENLCPNILLRLNEHFQKYLQLMMN